MADLIGNHLSSSRFLDYSEKRDASMRSDNGVYWTMLEVDFASGSSSISNRSLTLSFQASFRCAQGANIFTFSPPFNQPYWAGGRRELAE
jgi:hypothetical protein